MPENVLVQIIAGSHPGGAGKLFQEFAIEFAKRGIKQVIITRPYRERLRALRHPNIRVETVPLGSPYLDLYSRLKVRALFRRVKPRVVISWLQRWATFVPHGDYTHIGRLDGHYSRKYYKSADKFFAVSPPIAEYFAAQDETIADAVQTIPNFTLAATGFAPKRKATKRKTDITIITLSRFHKVKGYDLLIKAIVGLKGVRLLMVGEGPEEANLRNLVNSVGVAERVRFLPWQSNITAALAQADVLAMPSRMEAFGLPFIDAWAHKKAVIASKSAGPISHIRHLENGMLCEVGSVESLRQAILALLKDKALINKLAANGYNEWKRKFSPKVVVDQWMEILANEGLRVTN